MNQLQRLVVQLQVYKISFVGSDISQSDTNFLVLLHSSKIALSLVTCLEQYGSLSRPFLRPNILRYAQNSIFLNGKQVFLIHWQIPKI